MNYGMLLALSGHRLVQCQCLLSGVKRTSFREKRTSINVLLMTGRGQHRAIGWNERGQCCSSGVPEGTERDDQDRAL
jgi:hypothetical protein